VTERIAQSWGREPVGYRQGELSGADGVAVAAVALIGGPAFLVGASFAADLELGLVQTLLVAPLGALLGGLLVGASARMAASTGAHSTWLLRPSFGSAGARLVSLARLAVIVIWAVVGLQVVGRWGEAALVRLGLRPASWLAPAVVAVVVLSGVGMVAAGVSSTVRTAIRRPLFWSSVILLALVAWRLVRLDLVDVTGETGGFWPGVQEATEMAIVFVPFVQTVARHLHDDDEAQMSFGVGYAVPATLVLVAGALFGGIVGGIPADLAVLVAGTVGGVLALAWILVTEVDQAFAAFAAGGAETAGILTGFPSGIAGGIVVALVAGFAMFGPTVDLGLGSLFAAIAFPAAVIAAVDFFLPHSRYYSQSELYGAVGESRVVNVVGASCWVVAVALGQVIDPIGPREWTAAMPDVPFSAELPWRLLMAVLGASAYLVLLRWQEGRTGRVQELRGVDRQVTNQP
jgi:purine-cytosine permease-like protein